MKNPNLNSVFALALITLVSCSSSMQSPGRAPASILNRLTPTSAFHAFNWVDYLAANPDLGRAGIDTEAKAFRHWKEYGMRECRRSTSSFNPAHYLSRYPDLQRAFGKDCKLAIEHWLNHGIYEKRVAINKNSTFGSLIKGNAHFGNEVMSIGASTRTAGAIDSLVYRNKEFINKFDHGRQISIAFRNDTFVTGECDNPTEPGSAEDGIKPTSTTKILELDAHMSGVLKSKVEPAFWTSPTMTTPDTCTKGPRNDGRYTADDQLLEKLVQVGFNGDPNIMTYDVFVHNKRADVPGFQIETPTGYLTYEFTRYTKLLADGSLKEINMDAWTRPGYGSYQFFGGEQKEPGIISTPDGRYAMGAYAPAHYGVNPTYALYKFPSPHPEEMTNKWSLFFRLGRLKVQTYHFRSYIVVGSLNEVRAKLHALKKTAP